MISFSSLRAFHLFFLRKTISYGGVLLSLKSLPPPFFLYLQVAISGQLSASLFYVSLESNELIGAAWKDVERIWLLERQLCGPYTFEMAQGRRVFIGSPGADTALGRLSMPPSPLCSTSRINTCLPPSVCFIHKQFHISLMLTDLP